MRYFFLSMFMCYVVTTSAQYFQQDLNYHIEATLDTTNHTLDAKLSLVYTNNSQNDLDKIYFHLWANAFSNKNTPLSEQLLQINYTDYYFTAEDNLGGYRSIDFMVDKQPLQLSYTDANKEIAEVRLPSTLAPGQSVKFEIEYQLDIPLCFVRLGHLQGLYHMVAWYPKPAVYDQDGWHTFPYLAFGEFYSEYGNYEVELNVPAAMEVMSSGTLHAATQQEQRKTYSFVLNDAHDFAWFGGKYEHIDQKEYQLSNGNVIEVQIAYNDHTDIWSQAIDKTIAILDYMSEYMGGYPYPSLKIVQDVDQMFGGAMEYPGIKLLQNIDNERELEYYLAHEIAHAWWYGGIGSNEREESYFDEGLATYLEQKYTRSKYGKDYYDDKLSSLTVSHDKPTMQHALEMQHYRCKHQALNTTYDDISAINYGLNAYQYGSLLMRYLEDYIGVDLMQKALSTFYNEWQYRHPKYEDLILHIEKIAKVDLGFVSEILKGDMIDNALEERNGSYYLVAKGVEIPVRISADTDQGTHSEWIQSTTQGTEIMIDALKRSIKVDPDHLTLDMDRSNNQLSTSGLAVKLGPKWDTQEKKEIYLLPALGYNVGDGYMFGFSAFNSSVPAKNFKWHVAPLYGINSKSLAGQAFLRYDQYQEEGAAWSYSLDAKSYNFTKSILEFTPRYIRINPSITYKHFTHPKSKKWVETSLQQIFTYTEEFKSAAGDNVSSIFRPASISRLQHQRVNYDVLQPSELKVSLEYNRYEDLFEEKKQYLKASLDFSQGYSFAKNKSFDIRLFAAAFLINKQRESSSYNNGLIDGSIALLNQGFTDYAYDEVFLDRRGNSKNSYRQIGFNGGRFKDALGSRNGRIGQSNNWAIAINLQSDFPIHMPSWLRLKAIFDFGVASTKSFQSDPLSNEVFYSGGIYWDAKIIRLYLPLIASKQISDAYKFDNRSLLSKITFSLDIAQYDPWKTIDRLNF